jgi:hypothetical protein
MTTNINLFGPPHSGKSTLASELFSKMKKLHCDVEHLQESVKYDAYTNENLLNKSYYSLFLNALNLTKWQGLTQYLINESSPLSSAIYDPKSKDLALEIFNLYENKNFLLKPIEPVSEVSYKGRNIRPEDFSSEFFLFFESQDIPYHEVESAEEILQILNIKPEPEVYAINGFLDGKLIKKIFIVPTTYKNGELKMLQQNSIFVHTISKESLKALQKPVVLVFSDETFRIINP